MTSERYQSRPSPFPVDMYDLFLKIVKHRSEDWAAVVIPGAVPV